VGGSWQEPGRVGARGGALQARPPARCTGPHLHDHRHAAMHHAGLDAPAPAPAGGRQAELGARQLLLVPFDAPRVDEVAGPVLEHARHRLPGPETVRPLALGPVACGGGAQARRKRQRTTAAPAVELAASASRQGAAQHRRRERAGRAAARGRAAGQAGAASPRTRALWLVRPAALLLQLRQRAREEEGVAPVPLLPAQCSGCSSAPQEGGACSSTQAGGLLTRGRAPGGAVP
jgi:hypothetical protein